MSITFPTFIDKEIVTPEKLNNFVQALESKFSAGLGTSEISWPLISGGDLYMNDNSIIGGAEILGIVNAGAPQYATDFASALIDGAAGCILIPPSTTITIDGEELAGSSLTIIGSGPTSILRLQSGASAGYMFRNTTANSKIRMANLTLDGNSEVGAGLQLRGANDVILDSVWFKNFTSEALRITDLSSTGSSQVIVANCHFSGGSGYHVHLDDCTDVEIANCTFEAAAEDAIYGVAADTNADMKRINVHDNIFDSCTKGAVTFKGAATFNTKWAHIAVSDNVMDAASIAASQSLITLGATGAALQYIACSDNICSGASANNINVFAQYGKVSGNVARSAGAVGLALGESEDIVVTGNNLRDATGYAIDASDSVDCVIRANDCAGSSAAADIAYSDSTDHYDNGAVVAPGPPRTFYTATQTITIPANLLQVNDHMRIVQNADITAGASDSLKLLVGGIVAAQILVNGTSLGQAQLTAEVVITAATTFDTFFSGYSESEGEALNMGYFQRTGINLTTAIQVTTSNTGASITRQGLLVELSRAEVQ